MRGRAAFLRTAFRKSHLPLIQQPQKSEKARLQVTSNNRHARRESVMSTEVVMPQMGESIAEGTITKWLKKVGEHVERDEPLFEISTDKVDAEIPSPVAGTLTEVRFKEGDTVEVNTVVALLDGGASGASTTAAADQTK